MILEDVNTFDPELKNKGVYLVSLGSLEQHGHYAPLGTDSFIQDAFLEKVKTSLPEVRYLPTIPIGTSWQHLDFNGTLSFRPETLYSMISDIVACLKASASTIVFVSWHGGNKPVVNDFIEKEQSSLLDIKLGQITFGDEGTDEKAESLLHGFVDDHAGNTEVSLMLAIRPDITTKPGAEDAKQNVHFEWDKRIIQATPDGTIDEHPRWVATSEIGNRLIEIYSDNLITKLRAFL